MKRIIFCIMLTVLSAIPNVYASSNITQNPQNIRLLDYKDYKNIKPENIKAMKIIRYTEAGINEKNTDDKALINEIYNYLSQIKISNEAKMGCTDNTTIYSFTLNDNSTASIEIECDWIVLKGKNYNYIRNIQ